MLYIRKKNEHFWFSFMFFFTSLIRPQTELQDDFMVLCDSVINSFHLNEYFHTNNVIRLQGGIYDIIEIAHVFTINYTLDK